MIVEKELEQVKIENASLKESLTITLARITQLEAQLAQNSHNSSKPPSSGGFNRPTKNPNGRSLRKANGKRPCGQTGNRGGKDQNSGL
jgi:hypothetical protein